MKTTHYIFIILFSLQASSCFSQTATIAQAEDPDNEPYLGTWAYQEGDQIFRLFLKEAEDSNSQNNYKVIGNYEMVETNPSTGEEIVIYTSIVENAPDWFGAFGGYVKPFFDGVSGIFREFHAHGLHGSFSIALESSCLTCPQKIRWKVKQGEGIRIRPIGEPAHSNSFEVPSDILLEKVE
jgi:hypothetical protein